MARSPCSRHHRPHTRAFRPDTAPVSGWQRPAPSPPSHPSLRALSPPAPDSLTSASPGPASGTACRQEPGHPGDSRIFLLFTSFPTRPPRLRRPTSGTAPPGRPPPPRAYLCGSSGAAWSAPVPARPEAQRARGLLPGAMAPEPRLQRDARLSVRARRAEAAGAGQFGAPALRLAGSGRRARCGGPLTSRHRGGPGGSARGAAGALRAGARAEAGAARQHPPPPARRAVPAESPRRRVLH